MGKRTGIAKTKSWREVSGAKKPSHVKVAARLSGREPVNVETCDVKALKIDENLYAGFVGGGLAGGMIGGPAGAVIGSVIGSAAVYINSNRSKH